MHIVYIPYYLLFEKWFESPSPNQKNKKKVFEQFFTDLPPPEGGSAKVPPAGSHFGRYFCTPLLGGSPGSGRQCSIDFI